MRGMARPLQERDLCCGRREEGARQVIHVKLAGRTLLLRALLGEGRGPPPGGRVLSLCRLPRVVTQPDSVGAQLAAASQGLLS